MENSKFDRKSLSAPTSAAEYLALMDLTISALDYIDCILDEFDSILEHSNKKANSAEIQRLNSVTKKKPH